MRYLLLGTLVVGALACGDSLAPPPFEPALEFEYTITTGPAPDLNVDYNSKARTSEFLSAGETLHGKRYSVPGYRCLRADGTDWNDLPGGATAPGEAAMFEVLSPAPGTDSGMLVFMPHGDDLEFIESIALEVYKGAPATAAMFGVDPVHGTRGVEQSTRHGARRNVVSQSVGRMAVAMARLGATVVLPGNCWGDGAHGTGEDRHGYYDGPRLGGWFDHAVWTWARAEIAHDPARAVAVACSGGGHRIGEELIRDPAAFQAAIIDSPADDTAEFLTDPWPGLIADAYTFLRGDLFGLMDKFYQGTFGGKEEAARASLGAALPGSDITLPIYLIHSSKDPLVTPPVVKALVAAVTARGAPSVVVGLDLPQHCQLNTDERMTAATDWLLGVLGP